MNGKDLRLLMKERQLKTTVVAQSLGIHPQTIRNLWSKPAVPRLYMMAIIAHAFALDRELGLSEDQTPVAKREFSSPPSKPNEGQSKPAPSKGADPWDLLK